MNRILRLFLLVQLVIFSLGTLGCGEEETENECEKEKSIRMEAIQIKCNEPNLVGCCYCSCELSGTPTEGCTCDPNALTSTRDTTVCEGGALNNAVICTGNPTSCADQTKTSVALKCP